MQIVIDIPKDVKNRLAFGVTYEKDIRLLCEAISNGTPLPKGHGKLMDADAFVDFLKNISKTQGYDEFIINKQLTGVTVDDVFNAICESLQDENTAPTIIEADKEDKDE